MNHCPPTTHPGPGRGPASTLALPDAQAVLADMTHFDDKTIIRAAKLVRDQSPDLTEQADAVVTLRVMTGGKS